MEKTVVKEIVDNKEVRNFLINENISVESLCKIISDCLSENVLMFNGFNGLNEIYVNNNRLTLKERETRLDDPRIIIKSLRYDNSKTFRIVRRGRKNFEAILEC